MCGLIGGHKWDESPGVLGKAVLIEQVDVRGCFVGGPLGRLKKEALDGYLG